MESDPRTPNIPPADGYEVIAGVEMNVWTFTQEELVRLRETCRERLVEAKVDVEIVEDVYNRRFGAEGGV